MNYSSLIPYYSVDYFLLIITLCSAYFSVMRFDIRLQRSKSNEDASLYELAA